MTLVQNRFLYWSILICTSWSLIIPSRLLSFYKICEAWELRSSLSVFYESKLGHKSSKRWSMSVLWLIEYRIWYRYLIISLDDIHFFRNHFHSNLNQILSNLNKIPIKNGRYTTTINSASTCIKGLSQCISIRIKISQQTRML